jgi:hypothetical protein
VAVDHFIGPGARLGVRVADPGSPALPPVSSSFVPYQSCSLPLRRSTLAADGAWRFLLVSSGSMLAPLVVSRRRIVWINAICGTEGDLGRWDDFAAALPGPPGSDPCAVLDQLGPRNFAVGVTFFCGVPMPAAYQWVGVWLVTGERPRSIRTVRGVRCGGWRWCVDPDCVSLGERGHRVGHPQAQLGCPTWRLPPGEITVSVTKVTHSVGFVTEPVIMGS